MQTARDNAFQPRDGQSRNGGLSIAISSANTFDWNLSLTEIYLALANEVPVDGECVANPCAMWSEIDSLLPEIEIIVLGPRPTSCTGDTFVELAIWAGCAELPYVSEGGFDEDWIEENCSRMPLPIPESGADQAIMLPTLTRPIKG